MKKHILYFMLGIVVICYAITFDRIYGGTDEEYGFCVKQTNDGGYILAGSTQSSGAGGRDGWLIKTDMNGEIEWDEVSGGTLDDYFLRVEQTSDDGFIVLGAQNMDNDNGDFWLIKYDKTGKEKWSKVYQYSDSAIVGRDIQITSDDGFVIVGSKFNYNYNDLWVLKTDDRGEEVWSRTYDFGYEDYATSVIVNNTGNYVVVGSKQSYKTVLAGNDPPYMMEIQQEDILVVEINDSGAFINSNIIGSAYSDEYCYSIQNTFDSGYILTGIKNPFEYSVNTDTKDLILLKLDAWLNEDWNKIFDGNGDELGNVVNETANNNLIILGRTTSYGAGDYDYWLLKTDSSGNELWSRTYGDNGHDYANSLDLTTDNGYILIGENNLHTPSNDIYLVKTDEFGNVIYPPTITYFENDSNNVTLDWDIVSNAGSYVIYGSDRPDSNFVPVDSTSTNTWSTTTADSTFKKFYYIKSSTENISK